VRTASISGRSGSRGHDQRGVDAAALLQAELETALCALVEQNIGTVGYRDLCMAGGVALNCVANDRIRRLPSVTGLFVPPAASDRGQA
jgi:carbamoyltransferase